MYQQLSAWVLHGILIDKHNEFFIKEITSADKQTANWTDDSAAGMSNGDLGIPGITGRQLAEILVIITGFLLPGRFQQNLQSDWFQVQVEFFSPTQSQRALLLHCHNEV